MLKETKTEETIVFFVTFLLLVAFQGGGGGRAPWPPLATPMPEQMRIPLSMSSLCNKYGVRGVPLQLIESFLTNRQQYTIIKSTKSATNKVLCGIPQGSTLGPLLFTIYINDFRLVFDFKEHLFADDTNLSLMHSQLEMLQ